MTEKANSSPQVVKKNQTDISKIEDQVLPMYAKGMTTRDISSRLHEVYVAIGIRLSGFVDAIGAVFPKAEVQRSGHG